jgi:hypothetical protein
MKEIIILFIILLILFSIWDIKESFIGSSYLWIPTRNTRLMSYDLRGDPFGYILYPSYWNIPYTYYAFSPNRYDIFGRYIKPKIIKKKKVDKKVDKK